MPAAPPEPRTGGELLAEQLLAQGVDTIFGVPGAQLDWCVDGLARQGGGIRFVHARHEQGAAYMADGYARSTGWVGVVLVVPGPGMLNATAALSTAWACSSPVVAIVAGIPTHAEGRGLGVLHEIRGQSAILANLTKWSARATTAEQLPELVAEAFAQALSGRPRPVALEVPADLFSSRVAAGPVAPRPARPTEPATDEIARAASALRAARRPVIVAGNGVVAADAQGELAQVAERLGAPVSLTNNGRSALDARHPLCLPNGAGRALVADADVVLGVGTRFVSLRGEILSTAEDRTLVLLNADPADMTGRGADITVTADARLGLAALADALAGGGAATATSPDLTERRVAFDAEVAAIEPLAGYVRALRSAIPDDGFLITDLTQVGYLANGAFPVHRPRGYLTSGFQGTLGYGFPTALGVKVANPSAAVVAVAGDGGFGYCLNELATAVAHDIALVTVCFADGAFGNVRRAQAGTFGGRYLATELANPDFVALGQAFGVHTAVADDAEGLEQSLKEALSLDRPALVVVPMPPAPDLPSPWSPLT